MIKRIKTSIYSRNSRLTKRFLSGKGFIFMLHRVLLNEERIKYTWNKGLAISPEKLEEWVLFFRSKKMDVISLDEALVRCENNDRRKFVVITLDDGYKDNLTIGLPLFKKLNIPVTIYISTCFPDNKTIYWWYFLEEFILKNNSIDLNSIGLDITFRCESVEEKNKAYNYIREVLRRADYATHVNFAHKVCGLSDLEGLNKKLNLSWGEVKELSEEPLVTIGAHTMHHVSLANQKEELAKVEILQSKSEIEAKINKKVDHFAYPYGSLDDGSKREFFILKKAGFKSAVFNHPGSLFSVDGENKFKIPRMGLTDETSKRKVVDLFEGKVHLNFNGVNKTIC
ncbi:MAG: polysaccharide deacetylase family protein [Flavobacteriales bacterium]|nr:polysaccharide deacetylase family protein [Flavobacteriales bacterium]